ncbi:MAG: hypothetical protein ACOC6B_00375 [Thermodesulfobacteriota bacterium]
MVSDESARGISNHESPVWGLSGRQPQFPPWLFHHRQLVYAFENAETIDKEALTNAFNFLHFMDGYTFVHLNHPRFDESILLRAYPEPCLGERLTCRWSGEYPSELDLKSYQFMHLIIDDGQSMIFAPGTLEKMDQEEITVLLPEISYATGQRGARRYLSRDIEAELIQGEFIAKGELLDFNSNGFRTKVSSESYCSFHWFNSNAPTTVALRKKKKVLFSGTCRCIRQMGSHQMREIVLTPTHSTIQLFKKRLVRNPRQRLTPSPTVIFNHPFLNKRIQREVLTISTSGISLYEKQDEGVLIPGLILPELTIDFAGALKMKCAAQVIYCSDDRDNEVRCGLSILDMDIETYTHLTHLLSSALEPHTFISNQIDLEALWAFFFDTGFIYPTKYRLVGSHREEFKETYRKLYQENPEIARHFTFQKDGRIYGHISMVRAYDRAWMIHHHAAKAVDNKKSGFIVLKQIMYYLNDLYRLPSAKMDYVICYFRPENKFPNIVFAGFAHYLKNPRGCSMDLFSYLPYTRLSIGALLPEQWSLEESSTMDLWDLSRFYGYSSGGLLLNALGLNRQGFIDKSLEKLYGRLGFLRKLNAHSLKHKGKLNAVLIVNQSDLGMNLSELLNGVKVIVTNPNELPWSVLSVAIAHLIQVYHTDRVPVMLYPHQYVKDQRVPCEKHYQLWILNVQYGNEYLEYMQQKFRISYR